MGPKPDQQADHQLITVAFDFIPNSLGTPELREEVAQHMRAQLEQALPGALDRYSTLPAIVTPLGPFNTILDEARKHYVWGRFYSCVLVAGVTAERILRDLLRASLRVTSGDVAVPIPDVAAKHIDRLSMEDVREFLIKAGKLDSGLRKAAQQLAALRNKYAHGGGTASGNDARAAVDYLHEIVEGTVSVFRDYEIDEGVLVPRRRDEDGALTPTGPD